VLQPTIKSANQKKRKKRGIFMKNRFKKLTYFGFNGLALVKADGNPKVYTSRVVAEMKAKRLSANVLKINKYLIVKE